MALQDFSVELVSQRNTSYLFQDAIRKSRRAIKKSRLLLAQLQLIHRPTSQNFMIKDFHELDLSFRLLRENSRQVKTRHHTFESFIALSYCRHDKGWVTARCLGRSQSPWPVSTRLFSGLLNERISPDEGVWIDALCIDQKNDLERQKAISCMNVIYESARLVTVVLEDISISRSEEALLRNLLDDEDRSSDDREAEFLNMALVKQINVALVLFRILSARWFKRAWCSHELQVGTDFVFLIPTMQNIYRMTPEKLEYLYTVTVPVRLSHKELEDLYVNETSYEFLTRALYNDKPQSEKPLMCQFNDIVKLGCSVERDKISISMNVANLQLSYVGKDISKNECYWILAMIALSSRDATVLDGLDAPLKLNDWRGIYHVNSWLRLNDQVEDPMADFGGSTLQQFGCICEIDPTYVILELLYLPTVSVKKPTACSIQNAENFIADFLKLYEDKDIYNDLKEDPTYRKSMIEILACSVDCGIDWLMQRKETTKILDQIPSWREKLEFDLWSMIFNTLLDNAGRIRANNADFSEKDKLSVLRYVLFVLGYGHNLFRESLYDSGLFKDTPPSSRHARILEFGQSVKAITLMGNHAIQRSWMISVVPVALSSPSCALSRRLWVLDLVEGTRNLWTIVEKLPFFTLESILENPPDIVRLRRQVIVGKH